MGSATKWLFSASISLAFVAGCTPANAQANQIRGWFSEADNYKGTVEGEGNNNYGDLMQINLLHQCYASFDPDSCTIYGNADSSFTPIKNFWSVDNTDATDPKFEIKKFKTTGGMPGLDLYGSWDKYFKESDGDIVEVYGRMVEFKSILNQNVIFSGVELNCVGNGCVDLEAANPGGVDIEFRNSVSNQGYERDFYISLVNPASIKEIGGGGSSCFQEDGTGVKVPEAKTCSTDDKKFSGEYASLKVEDQGKLNLGGNLILEDKLTSFEVQDNALVEGSGGLVKTGNQITVLKGSGTFAYEGDVYVHGGVLEITNATGLGSTKSGTYVEKNAVLKISVSGEESPTGSSENEVKIFEKISLSAGELDLNGDYIDLQNGIVLQGDQNSTIHVKDESRNVFVRSTISGKGGLIKTGQGFLRLGSQEPQQYQGKTIIKEGKLVIKAATTLPESTDVLIEKNGKLMLKGEGNKIQSLNGSGILELPNLKSILTSGLSGKDDEFSGVISGDGGFTKAGTGTTTFSGANANTYTGATNVQSGRLTLANVLAIDKLSSTVVNGTGQLDLYTYSANNALDRGKEFKINQVEIKESGQLFVSARNPLVAESIKLEADESGGIVVGIFEKTDDTEMNKAPIRVSTEFAYVSGNLNVKAPLTDDPEGTWNIIDGTVNNADDLANNTYLVTSGRSAYQFKGVNEPVYGPAMYKGYLEDGSLNLIINAKTPEELECQLHPEDCTIDLPSPDEEVGNLPPIDPPTCEGDDCAPVIPPTVPPTCEGDECLSSELPKPEPLPGCETGSDLCDIISDIPGDEDDALGQEEDLAGDVIDALLDGLAEEEIDLPLSFDYGQLAKLVTSGLLPRNVDAPGRSLFNYNNLMVDTVFERLPLRQFKAVEVAAVVEEEAAIVEPEAVVPAEPIRGLWSQAEGMDEQQAQEYLEQRVAQGDQVVVEDVDFELDGIGYVEDPSLTGQYANRDGVRAWYKVFGGDTGPSKTSTLYGDYNASASGMVLGADVSLGSNVQIGVFGNYGDINLYQYSGDTGSGSWNPTGWGGGVTADWWSKNFYVQGLISASSFSGNQKRNIIAINEQFGNETARGDKTVTSYSYALRLGAPFEAGRLLLEPQFTAAWTQNQESGFTENGADQLNLRYGSRTTNFLQTELGMKFALPIKSGERAEWVPNLRVAWLGDWNQNNEDQSIGYAFTDQTVGVDSLEENQNGVLIEGGLDYTMANINNGSWKLYVRGGAEVWGGERGTDWRASGGMTWQF